MSNTLHLKKPAAKRVMRHDDVLRRYIDSTIALTVDGKELHATLLSIDKYTLLVRPDPEIPTANGLEIIYKSAISRIRLPQ